jgi:peroxin-3
VEELTKELQKKRAERLARLNPGEGSGSDMTSVAASVNDDRNSLSSFQSEGYVHASQVESGDAEGQPQVKRNKTQLWNEVKITCMRSSVNSSIFGLHD